MVYIEESHQRHMYRERCKPRTVMVGMEGNPSFWSRPPLDGAKSRQGACDSSHVHCLTERIRASVLIRFLPPKPK